MTEKSIAELEAEITAAQLEIDRKQLVPLQAVIDAFNKPTIVAALAACRDNLDLLTGERRQQVQNLITVLANSPTYLAQQAAAIDARVNPPAAPEPEAPAA